MDEVNFALQQLSIGFGAAFLSMSVVMYCLTRRPKRMRKQHCAEVIINQSLMFASYTLPIQGIAYFVVAPLNHIPLLNGVTATFIAAGAMGFLGVVWASCLQRLANQRHK